MANVAKKLSLLEVVLTEEQSALKSGEILKLSDIDARKVELLTDLSQIEDLDSETLKKLRAIAKKNHALMEAAHSGVKAARDRFEALLAAQKPMTLYGPKGQKSSLKPLVTPSVERRT